MIRSSVGIANGIRRAIAAALAWMSVGRIQRRTARRGGNASLTGITHLAFHGRIVRVGHPACILGLRRALSIPQPLDVPAGRLQRLGAVHGGGALLAGLADGRGRQTVQPADQVCRRVSPRHQEVAHAQRAQAQGVVGLIVGR